MGEGPSGGLSALSAIFQEPYLFDAAVAHNAITDLPQHMMVDVTDRQFMSSTEGSLDFELNQHRKLNEFGDPEIKLFYEM